MKITYYGHSCFFVEHQNQSILFDPYADASVPGLQLPNDIATDQVYCSHDHADHNASNLVSNKNLDPWNNQFLEVPHDHHNGTKRGFSKITSILIDGVKIVHLGDIGRIPTEDECAFLKDTTILMIPVGGYYTIDSLEANQIIQTMKPSLTILMHYRDENIGYDVLEDIESVMMKISHVQRYDTSTIEITEQLLKQNSIITLKPKQK